MWFSSMICGMVEKNLRAIPNIKSHKVTDNIDWVFWVVEQIEEAIKDDSYVGLTAKLSMIHQLHNQLTSIKDSSFLLKKLPRIVLGSAMLAIKYDAEGEIPLEEFYNLFKSHSFFPATKEQLFDFQKTQLKAMDYNLSFKIEDLKPIFSLYAETNEKFKKAFVEDIKNVKSEKVFGFSYGERFYGFSLFNQPHLSVHKKFDVLLDLMPKNEKNNLMKSGDFNLECPVNTNFSNLFCSHRF